MAPSLDTAAIDELAESFCAAEESLRPRPLVTESLPDLSLDDAYAIQFAAVERKRAAGRRLLGYKVGFASRAIQEAFGVHEPMFGHLLDGAMYSDGDRIPRGRYIHPGIEPELAFIMARPLHGPGITAAQVLAATQFVLPAFEIVDVRFPTWKFTAADSIADNGFNAGAVLAEVGSAAAGVDLRLIGMVMEKNGEVVGTAAGAAVLGHPAGSVAWLVNKLADTGRRLEPGQIVLAGSFTTTYPVNEGDVLRASYARLGSISARFT